MQITIGGAVMPKITRFSAEYKTRRTEIEYNTKGDLLIDLVARKYTLTIEFGALTAQETALIREKTEGVFCEVSFPDAAQTITRSFHLAGEPFAFLAQDGTVPCYNGIKLVLEEK